jgi:solute:Na+ symporter, SSS family
MLNTLGFIDTLVLIILLLAMPLAGIIASWRKKNSEDYFMAGRSLSWWMVAGSVFGTNINSSHLIGMLGIGYSVGFAQSHYEVLAVGPILLLCYVFLPAYRNLKVFTLSQYLEHRYNEQARLIYTILMILLILVQLIAAFYIGSRTLGFLFRGSNYEITYLQGIILIGLFTCSYTVFGGLGAVVVTDTMQTVMMLLAGVIVAIFTFSQPEIGGFLGLLELESQLPAEARKMQLYLPSHHPDLPFTGAFTGLLILHCFYWTTNQYLVQRTLAAKTDVEARIGIIASGFLKLTIPFFSVASGVAAAYLFKSRAMDGLVLPDDAFLSLVELVIPIGYGLTGLILAGLTAATFSSVDSMMNSATTLLTLDIYKKYLNPQASENQMITFGRVAIVLMVFLAGGLALVSYDPKSAGNFFLSVSARGSYFTPGVVAVFFVGIFWKKAHPQAAMLTMLSAPFIAFGLEAIYNSYLVENEAIKQLFGAKLNFMHRVFLNLSLAVFIHISLSKFLKPAANQAQKEAEVMFFSLRSLGKWLFIFMLLQIIFIALLQFNILPKNITASLSGISTLLLFVYRADFKTLWQNDKLYAGLLSGVTMFILYFFA